MGDRVHALPRSELSELRDRVKSVRYGVSVRVGNIIVGCVDSDVGSWFVIASEIIDWLDN